MKILCRIGKVSFKSAPSFLIEVIKFGTIQTRYKKIVLRVVFLRLVGIV